MNIFVLDTDPKMAAQYHCDKHVVKMILETAQILSTVRHVRGCGNDKIYRPTHKHHPCTIWAGRSSSNYFWTLSLMHYLGKEYTHRYGKVHKSMELYGELAPSPFPTGYKYDPTPFARAMPDQYKLCDSAVESYRLYYTTDKAHMLKYTNRDVPYWVSAESL